MTAHFNFTSGIDIQMNNTLNNRTSHSSSSALKTASDISITASLVVIMLGMGCTIEIKSLMKHIRRPVGICIGMLSQFVVLPVVTFGLAHALQLPPLAAIGMLVVGCCPGGSTTNIFSYWTDGDVSLSISMTAVSTLMAIGMMPLNLLIYSRSWTDTALVIPYINILKSFGMTIGPAVVGILVRWKIQKLADILVKCGSFAGAISVVLVLTLMSIRFPYMYLASWKIYIAALILPFAGFLFGYVVAMICRQDPVRCRTIALETGIQNFPLCMTLLLLTFSKEIFAQISLFPLLYGVTCIVCSLAFLGIYKIVKKVNSTREKKEEFTRVSTIEDDKFVYGNK
ncbi:ileal sodium/bile acid cotransporter-like [Mytilus galloprovincialis]|uniref:ileal sodium/bile acid cotransporter-like n=1 Tax=Mytilus galloprovincialis TaxID=29158 RepID=UPI003F7BB2FF